MDARKLVAIVNPAAGDGAVGERLQSIRQALTGGFAAGVYQTLRPGHAEEWARTFSNAPGFLVIGGDGTVHEVLTGMNTATQSLAVLPSGTSNSLGRDLGLPDLAATLDAVAEGRTEPVDVVQATFRDAKGGKRSCVVGATLALGFPVRAAGVARHLGRGWSAMPGPLATFLGAVGVPAFTATVRADGARAKRRRMTGLLVGATRHAGNLVPFPRASLTDGKFDVMEMNAGVVGQSLHTASLFTRGSWWKPASQGQAKRLSVVLTRPAPLMIDGELYPAIKALDVSIRSRQLALYVPRGLHPA